jgi:hypothetical protein
METREFNTIFVNYDKGLLTKTSRNTPKLKDEINYYLKLPDNILSLFPKLIDYREDFSSYTIEYIPYKSLSELILNNKINIIEAKNVLDRLFVILDSIHSIKSAEQGLTIDKNFLIQKTIDRIATLENSQLFSYLSHNSITINNKIYKNFRYYKKQFTEILEDFFNKNSLNTIIHGDFSFSNILYCPISKNIKLIDPRGSFGSKGIYGHPYYDYAKLMHCIHGNYDSIVCGGFKLTEKTKVDYDIHINTSPLLKKLYLHFKDLLNNRKLNLKILHLIESSLFLSMTALHYEDPERQKLLFLNGLILMNNFFEEDYENLY